MNLEIDDMIEVPMIRPYDLKHSMFQYILDAKKDESWDGRTSVRISSLTKYLVSVVDSNYGLGNKTNTLTALSYIGCFRSIDYINNEQWNKFMNCNANMDLDALSLCDNVGTDKQDNYYSSMFALSTVGYIWVDNLQKIWPVPDKKKITYHIHNDHRLGKMIDVFTDKFGFSVKETINLFVLCALKDSDGLKNHPQSHEHLSKIDKILKYNSSIMNKRIQIFNECYMNMY